MLIGHQGDRSEVSAAADIGCSPSALSNWKDGKCLPTGVAIPALAIALGVPVDDLRALIQAEREARAAAKNAAALPKEELCRQRDEHGVTTEFTDGTYEFVPHGVVV